MRIPEFSERLKSLMAEKEVDSRVLAKGTGICKKTIQKWLEGKTKPNIEKLIIISRYFEKSVDYVIGLKSQNE